MVAVITCCLWMPKGRFERMNRIDSTVGTKFLVCCELVMMSREARETEVRYYGKADDEGLMPKFFNVPPKKAAAHRPIVFAKPECS